MATARRGDLVRFGLVPATLVGVAALSVIYPTLAPMDAVALAAILCLFLSRGMHPGADGAAPPAPPAHDEFLSTLIEHSGEVICVIDRATVVGYVSPSGPRMLGWSDDAVIGCSALDLVHPVDRAIAAEGLAGALATPGLSAPLEVQVLDGRGGWRLVEMVANNLLDDPSVDGVVLTVRDLVDQRPRATDFEYERDFTAAVVETVGVMVVVLDRAGRIVRFNRACQQTTGWTFAEVEGRTFWDLFVPPAEIPRVLQRWDAMTAASVPAAYENDCVARDGSLRRVAWTTTALCDPEGHLTYVVSTGIDVTETRHGQLALANSERAFRTLADNSTDIITRTTLTGLFVYVSPSVESVLGYTPAHLVNRSATEIIHTEDWANFAKSLETAEEGTAVQSVFRALRSDGTYTWCESSSRMRRDPITGEMEVQASTRDISDRRQVEELYRTLVELCPDALLVYDEHEIGYANQSAADLFGVARPEDLLGVDPASFIQPEQREAAVSRDQSIMVEGRRVHGFERTCVRSDGRTVKVESSAGPLQVGDRTVVMAILRDVTERRRAQAAVETSERRLRTSLDALLDGFADYEAVRNPRGDIVDFRILYINPSGLEPWGLAPRQVIGHQMLELAPEESGGTLFQAMVSAVETGQPERREVTMRSRQGDRTFEAQAVRMGDGVILSFRDVTERRAVEERLAHAATHDELTGLPNRAMFVDRLERALARSRRGDGHVAVLYLDLDRFKVVNDSLGHSAGDELLVTVATRLSAALRPSDMVARLGGDEFVVVTEGVTGLEEAQSIGRRIEEVLAEPIIIGGSATRLSSSVGITMAGPTTTPGELLRDADAAMYRAKRLGRGRQEVFDDLMRSEAVERLEVEMGLHRALENAELRVFYQPLLELATGTTVGYEALVRWAHPDRGLLGPADFLPIAGETGLVVPIGHFVLNEACRQLAEWLESNGERGRTGFNMAVNVSAAELANPDFVEFVQQVLADHGLATNRLCLEVTEQAATIATSAVGEALAALRSVGVSLAIDDFGTGYSSLSHIRTLPVDVVKIDRMFVQGLGRDAADESVVAAVAQLATQLGMTVMAEGIETVEQRDRSRELGCQFGQGYLFGVPAPASEITVPFPATAE